MPFHTECPECEAAYHLPDEQEGRRVRCKKCQAVFVAEPVDHEAPSEVIAERPAAKPRPTAVATAPARADDAAAPVAPTVPHHKPLPWIVGGVVACVALLTFGAIVVAIILKPASAPTHRETRSTPVASITPVSNTETPSAPAPAPMPPPAAASETTATPAPPPAPAPAARTTVAANPDPKTAKPAVPARPENGQITREARDKVKRATVYIQVTFPDGRQVSGSGFFGSVKNANLVLTNAHVVGMLAPESHKPTKVELVINSGESNMKKTQARVLGVDRYSDLAVLDVGTAEGMPPPLTIKSADALQVLDPVYIFGFPFGKAFGEEITVRPSSVSAMRKRNGVLEKVQVAGGMDHGNSGGPVVDSSGEVVGVAVSGVEGSLINFAIPGERVTSILKGRFSQMAVGYPFTDGVRVNVPVLVEMIDPQTPSQIKSVAVEVWTGNRGEPLPPGDKAPTPRAGDSPRQRVELNYSAGLARGILPLPELPHGRVYWIQPVYVTGDETLWAGGVTHDFKPELAVERKPVNLKFRPSSVTNRQVSVVIKNIFHARVDDDDEEPYTITRSGDFLSHTADSDGSTERMEYRRIKHEILRRKMKVEQDPTLGIVEANLSHFVALLRYDSKGNPRERENAWDLKALYSGTIVASAQTETNTIGGGRVGGGILAASPAGQELLASMKAFLQPTQLGMALTAVPLPGEDNCAPDKAWLSSEERYLPIEHLGRADVGQVKLTYTYLGQRQRNRRTEAVIDVQGDIGDKEGKQTMGGPLKGTAVIDVASGVATDVNLTAIVDGSAITYPGSDRQAMLTLHIHLSRGF